MLVIHMEPNADFACVHDSVDIVDIVDTIGYAANVVEM